MDFRYPWTLTAVHTFCSAVGATTLWLRGSFTPTKLSFQENVVMLAISVLYTINIAISNVSLNMVSVPFHQVVRAMTPIFTVMISIVFLRTTYSKAKYLALLPVIFGVGFATFGEYDFTLLGFLLTVLGTGLAALKTVVTNRVQVGRLKLHPLDLLLRMSPIAFVQTVIYSYFTGELSEVRHFVTTDMHAGMYVALLLNGIVAFSLNVVSFTANKQAGPVTMTVAGNVKQVLSIVLAIFIFNLRINPTNAFGILLTLFGGAYYALVDAKENKKPLLPSFEKPKSLTEESMIDLIISENSSSSHLYEKLAETRQYRMIQ
ncbi:triose-phosphate transporter family-domain-containing protein [Umbelopsis sp. AD052]|nr:triose-phosphate transporter family-domain-containing protein [Umbelopsis sp. AD052]